MDCNDNKARLELALIDLSKQTVPNFLGTSKRFQVNRTTLRRRFLGQQVSRTLSRASSTQRLTTEQEKVLIKFINEYTELSLPPTAQLVKNCAEELCGGPVGKNWVAQFTHRHKDKLYSGYIRVIDSQRINAEYKPMIQKFYDQV